MNATFKQQATSGVMNVTRTLRPRLLRPHLSSRYQHLRRSESTAAGQTTTSSAPPPQPSFLKRFRSPILWSSLALALGFTGGSLVSHTLAPPPMPEPGTHEDGVLMADLNKQIDEDFKVKVLRGKCLGVAKQLKGAEGGWVEIVPPPPEDTRLRGDGLVEKMQGAKGLGVERLFWDRGEHKLVAVIWFGGSLCGWPGVTHGGAIATALSDKLALAASLAENRNSQATSAAAIPQRMPGTGNHAKMFSPSDKPDEPAQLSLSYVKPTLANGFYVIRVQPSMDLEQDPAKIVPTEPPGGHEYEATLETLDARICVKAKARFEASNVLQRTGEQVQEAAKSTYSEFREWMWPSRQQNSQID
ncbi:hypothetical protein D0865_01227 [Hortaea werneckii]|uniref:Thioesterase domain-containing protein n=1 Tax=Hortaea werneckii TaxID=91943 RepID=A0A3M7DA37_HORWE|nr:hypothetical protein D0865_01227 [Hortaea werneckii]